MLKMVKVMRYVGDGQGDDLQVDLRILLRRFQIRS